MLSGEISWSPLGLVRYPVQSSRGVVRASQRIVDGFSATRSEHEDVDLIQHIVPKMPLVVEAYRRIINLHGSRLNARRAMGEAQYGIGWDAAYEVECPDGHAFTVDPQVHGDAVDRCA